MNKIDVLRNFGLIDWSVLLFGMKKGFVSNKDIAQYASEIISNKIEDNPHIVDLADAVILDYLDIKEKIESIIDNNELHDEEANEKWLFAELYILDKSNLSEQDKFEKLQYIC